MASGNAASAAEDVCCDAAPCAVTAAVAAGFSGLVDELHHRECVTGGRPDRRPFPCICLSHVLFVSPASTLGTLLLTAAIAYDADVAPTIA